MSKDHKSQVSETARRIRAQISFKSGDYLDLKVMSVGGVSVNTGQIESGANAIPGARMQVIVDYFQKSGANVHDRIKNTLALCEKAYSLAELLILIEEEKSHV